MTIPDGTVRTRRNILAAASGGVAVLIASSLGRAAPVRAATGDNLILGAANSATAQTSLTATSGDNLLAALKVHATQGRAIVATTDDATAGAAIQASGSRGGVHGTAADPYPGVTGVGAPGVLGYGGAGVAGFGGTTPPTAVPGGVGVYGAATETGVHGVGGGTGLYGYAATDSTSLGVWGNTADGTGVTGTGFVGAYATGRVGVFGDALAAGTAVYGYTGDTDAPLPPGGVGVQATAATTGQVALNVTGKARFSRSGRATIGTGKSSLSVAIAGVTSGSLVFAELQTNRSGRYVRAVVPTTGRFTIYLNTTVTAATYVAYFVLN